LVAKAKGVIVGGAAIVAVAVFGIAVFVAVALGLPVAVLVG
jgi:hypothetical protein